MWIEKEGMKVGDELEFDGVKYIVIEVEGSRVNLEKVDGGLRYI